MKNFTRVSSVSPNLYLGNPKKNSLEILKNLDILIESNVEIAVFPELSICGYTCADIFYFENLLNECEREINQIVNYSKQKEILIVIGAPIKFSNRLYNSAIVIYNGKILGIVPKSFIPNSLEFYEKRWFSSGLNLSNLTINYAGTNNVPFGTDLLFKARSNEYVIGIEICEDLWSVIPPSSHQALSGANLILNLSASNELVGKRDYRLELVKSHSAKIISGYVYSSSGIGESTTDLVFSGHLIISENGSILEENHSFDNNVNYIIADIDLNFINFERLHSTSFNSISPQSNDFRYIEVPNKFLNQSKTIRKFNKTPFVSENLEFLNKNNQEIISIQIFALIQRLKYLNFPKIVIGISGGLDSTLALLISVMAFDKLQISRKNIIAVTMPGFGTTERTLNNAKLLCETLNVSFNSISINDAVNQHFSDIDFNREELGIVFENSQARERTQILMDLSNKFGAIVIGTGDLSEASLGWCTFNGDHISMYHINIGIPKTLIQHLIRYLVENQIFENLKDILIDILNTPITPELLPVNSDGDQLQLTESSVGPYILHDFFLYYFIRKGFTRDKIATIAIDTFGDMFTEEVIIKWHTVFFKRFYGQQFKRSVMPDGPKVGSVSLSPRGDWRMPSDIHLY